jgi:hypothetical protein
MWRKLAGGFAAYVKGWLRANHVCSSVPSSDLTWLGIILASAATLRYRVPILSCPTNIPCVSRVCRVSCCRGVVACLNLAIRIRYTRFPLQMSHHGLFCLELSFKSADPVCELGNLCIFGLDGAPDYVPPSPEALGIFCML